MTVSLRLAVCLFPGVTALDYQGPIELLEFISTKNLSRSTSGLFPMPPPYSIHTTYMSHNLEPVEPCAGPLILPNGLYDFAESANQYDIILVPRAPLPAVENAPPSIIQFIKRQAPGAKYILSVCTGSWFLAKAGVLNGKKATTNKSAFKHVVEDTKDLPITWVKKARWVVDDDNKLWTSSGVTSGQDLGNAFLQHLIGKPNTDIIRHIVELSIRDEGEDEFVRHYGLLED